MNKANEFRSMFILADQAKIKGYEDILPYLNQMDSKYPIKGGNWELIRESVRKDYLLNIDVYDGRFHCQNLAKTSNWEHEKEVKTAREQFFSNPDYVRDHPEILCDVEKEILKIEDEETQLEAYEYWLTHIDCEAWEIRDLINKPKEYKEKLYRTMALEHMNDRGQR